MLTIKFSFNNLMWGFSHVVQINKFLCQPIYHVAGKFGNFDYLKVHDIFSRVFISALPVNESKIAKCALADN